MYLPIVCPFNVCLFKNKCIVIYFHTIFTTQGNILAIL